jgi:hypothetical protein
MTVTTGVCDPAAVVAAPPRGPRTCITAAQSERVKAVEAGRPEVNGWAFYQRGRRLSLHL